MRPLGAVSLEELDAADPIPAGGYNPCEEEELENFDMVEWIVQSYAGHENSYLRNETATSTVSDFSLHDPVARRFYRISGPTGFGNEVFEYDEAFVFIRRETRHESPRDFLHHYAGYVWCPRIAVVVARTGRSCNPVNTRNTYDEYINCLRVGSGSTPFQVSVQGPMLLSLGGDIGDVVALRLRSTNLSNGDSEYYYYARPYGMVYFEKFLGGALAYAEVFNTFYTPEIPLIIECGIGY